MLRRTSRKFLIVRRHAAVRFRRRINNVDYAVCAAAPCTGIVTAISFIFWICSLWFRIAITIRPRDRNETQVYKSDTIEIRHSRQRFPAICRKLFLRLFYRSRQLSLTAAIHNFFRLIFLNDDHSCWEKIRHTFQECCGYPLLSDFHQEPDCDRRVPFMPVNRRRWPTSSHRH